jgi:prepilin-type N-terminal cleavage/methylation domain-containing protein
MKKGFTLIEMAVVLLIIGILVGIVLRNLGTQPIQARDVRRTADLHILSTYLVQYMTKQGNFPTGSAASDQSSWSTLQNTLQSAGINVPLPNSPSGNPYFYYSCWDSGGSNTSPNHFVLRTVLEQPYTQAPKVYEGTIGAVPTGWTCAGTGLTCATSTNNYCFIQ